MYKSAKFIITFLLVLVLVLLIVIVRFIVSESSQDVIEKEYEKSVDSRDNHPTIKNMSAYTMTKNNHNYLLLKKSGKEIIVDEGYKKYIEGQNDIKKIKEFSSIKFSPNKNYLIYTIRSYETESGVVYDVKNEKSVLTFSVSGENDEPIGFTPDEKYLYVCSSAGMGGMRIGKIFKVNNFQEVFDVFGRIISPETYERNNEFEGVDCRYDNDEKQIIFTLIDYQGKSNQKNIKWNTARMSEKF